MDVKALAATACNVSYTVKNTFEPGSEYNITYNEVDYTEIGFMLKNFLEQVREPFIRVNHVHNVFNTSTLRYYYSSEYKR